MIKRQKTILGSVIKIDLLDGYHSYGRILKGSSYAIYDIRTKEELNPEDVIQSNILFIINVYKYGVTKGRWLKIATFPLEPELMILPLEFMQDMMDLNKFELYDPNTGDIALATKEECTGLERAAVWEPEHVEERIRDHFLGRPNQWVEMLKMK